jgi:mannosyltransferase OCH1-like enzyme
MEINYTSSGIPKIIHQTWKTKDVPDHWKKSKDEWQRLHPDWLYILWTDEDIRNHIKDYHPDFLELHDNYEYNIQRADMIRYFILYDFGGIYSDLDQYPLENIEKYITTNLNYFVYSPNSDIITNQFMISPKHSLIMKKVQDNLKKKIPWYAFGKHLKIYYSTGPFMINKTLLNDIKEDFIILPRRKFNSYSIVHDKNITDDSDISINTITNTSTWNGIDTHLFNFVSKNKNFFICLGIVSLLLIIFGLIYYISKYKKCRESKVCIKQ